MLAVRFQRIRIKIRLAIQTHTGDQPVVKRSLQNIHILRIAVQQEQPLIPKRTPNRCARLVIRRHIRQIVVRPEALNAPIAPMPPVTYIFLPTTFSQIASIDLDVILIACHRRHVRHARIHVSGPHRMPFRFGLLSHWYVGLVVASAAMSAVNMNCASARYCARPVTRYSFTKPISTI